MLFSANDVVMVWEFRGVSGCNIIIAWFYQTVCNFMVSVALRNSLLQLLWKSEIRRMYIILMRGLIVNICEVYGVD